MTIDVRVNVTASFSVPLAVAENVMDAIAVSGSVRDFIDSIEIAEVASDQDQTIIRGTNG